MKYRKKPVVIDAVLLVDDNAGQIVAWINGHGGSAFMRGGPRGGSHKGTVHIDTLEGQHRADVGDYVIRGVAGEFYPCKPDIFKATYDMDPFADERPTGRSVVAEVESRMGGRFSPSDRQAVAEVIDEIVDEHG